MTEEASKRAEFQKDGMHNMVTVKASVEDIVRIIRSLGVCGFGNTPASFVLYPPVVPTTKVEGGVFAWYCRLQMSREPCTSVTHSRTPYRML